MTLYWVCTDFLLGLCSEGATDWEKSKHTSKKPEPTPLLNKDRISMEYFEWRLAKHFISCYKKKSDLPPSRGMYRESYRVMRRMVKASIEKELGAELAVSDREAGAAETLNSMAEG